ncbi:MAG: hypothetical protein QNJ32_01470 [Xenococcaceae cyanobacterium MO_167.B27]|nr:hypothetical protein [Xenococcaceae cyanobacterium MO_167.B27]
MKQYRKFLLLTCPRSGTHMLKSSLEAHPNVICLTEMFNPDYIEGKYPYDDSIPAKQVLDKFIYCDYDPEVKAVGFCLHRIGAKFGNWPRLWDILRDMKDLYVLSLSRENLLRRYLSVQLQQIKNLDKADLKPMVFDPEKLEQDFKRQRKKIAEYNERFSNHNIFHITYEQMCNDYETMTSKMQDFLGLPPFPLKPGTGKRNNPPISDFVVNYAELKDKFKDTEWGSFFDA